MGRADRLGHFKSAEHPCIALTNQGTVDLRTVSDQGRYRSAALGHSVDLIGLHVKAREHGGIGNNFAGQQDSLTTDTRQKYAYTIVHRQKGVGL